jgi:predicted enzyme involved in methoxymalonyl-ACP biosynthesis
MLSESIRALAQELNLGLDSFAFIDDNPIECQRKSLQR